MATQSSRKRKLCELETTSPNINANKHDVSTPNPNPSPPKKVKLNNQNNTNTNNDDHDIDQKSNPNTNFTIKEASNDLVKLFSSNTLNNGTTNAQNALTSLNAGQTDWKFEFYQMPIDKNNDIYKFLDLIFSDKLCDWKEYISTSNTNIKDVGLSNNFLFIIKDNFNIWRGAMLVILYELQSNNNNNIEYVIKLPLAGVDLHFRRQHIGSFLIKYMVSVVSSIINKYKLFVLVLNEKEPKCFWNCNNFIVSNLFSNDLMISKGFIKDCEKDLILMEYNGNMLKDEIFIQLKNELNMFIKPKFCNFNLRYCRKDEIEEVEKSHREWAKEKEKLLKKNKNKTIQDILEKQLENDDDDEDFDVETAKQLMSPSDDDNTDDDSDDFDDHNDDI